MKPIPAFVLALVLILSSVFVVSAQGPESIWLAASNTAYKRGETVTVTVNANSVTPIQGFTFQVRYDPACLEPVNAASPIPGMSGLSLPQTPGLVDASFASTTPQAANGVLAEVQFTTLAGCQTALTLESASLAIRNASGFAAELPGVTIGQNTVALNIDNATGTSQEQPLQGTPLALGPQEATEANDPAVPVAIFILLAAIVVILIIMFAVYKLLRR
jgi:hypothetical protein